PPSGVTAPRQYSTYPRRRKSLEATAVPVTDAQVREALRPVQDPELHQSIVDLGMLGDVHIDRAAVRVGVTLTVAGCPLRAELTDRVTTAVSALEGVDRV